MSTKIYTKTGDDGTTGLFGGARLPKDDIRIEAYGTVDELNAVIGCLRATHQLQEINQLLETIQSRLFTIGANLASDPGKDMITPDLTDEDITVIEQEIDRMQEKLPVLKHFIIPGGSTSVAMAHLARTVCRRAERRCVTLSHTSVVEHRILLYLNRLSDYFFVLARYLGAQEGVEETKWISRKKKME
ncbi:MAG TPA: cob(I)yrinic acid a,c-diamide adenosyltransferase [Saprospiraceae bacterium]|nr:cob(I)yrinic acid a,c-diamide adenosyltransferase [Saprospiraceae bacterium]